MRGHVNVDICLEMPASCLKPKDYWDYRYLAKRARWLQHIAEGLERSGQFQVRLGKMRGAVEKPCLLLTPLKQQDDRSWAPYTGQLGKVVVRVFACPPDGFFSPKRFHPSKSNLHRPKTNDNTPASKVKKEATPAATSSTEENSATGPATPYYNALLAEDLFYRSHLAELYESLQSPSSTSDSMRETLLLMKLWLKQRSLDQSRMGESDGWGEYELKWTGGNENNTNNANGEGAKSNKKKKAANVSSTTSSSSQLLLASPSTYLSPTSNTTAGGRGGFNGFFCSMFLLHLLKTKAIYRQMSTYQMFKQVLVHWVKLDMSAASNGGIVLGYDPSKNSLATLALLTNPLAGASAKSPEEEMLESYRGCGHDVVFLASEGGCNITSRVCGSVYATLRQEAFLSLATLDDSSTLLAAMFGTSGTATNASGVSADPARRSLDQLLATSTPLASAAHMGSDTFSGLFMEKIHRRHKYDAFVRIRFGKVDELLKKDSSIMAASRALSVQSSSLGLYQDEDVVTRLVSQVRLLLLQGLGDRSVLMDVRPVVDVASRELRVEVGLLLHPLHASRILDAGPSAEDTTASDQFRHFWGELSTLRRFKDGSIVEAVVWTMPGTDVGAAGLPHAAPQLIPFQIISYVLGRHLAVTEDQLEFLFSQFDSLLKLRTIMSQPSPQSLVNPKIPKDRLTLSAPNRDPLLAAGSASLFTAFKGLSGAIKSLAELPLTILSLRMLGEYSRYTGVFPPQACEILKLTPNRSEHALTEIVPILMQFESSGKWPEDSLAISRIKSAFYIQIGTALQVADIHTLVSLDFIDIFYHGFTFRLRIFYEQELQIRQIEERMGQTELGSAMIPVLKSFEIERDYYFQPSLSQSLKFVQETYPLFSSTCRLVKRWMAAHMFTGYLSSDVLDLAVAYLFTQPKPYTRPGSQFQGLYRWLNWFVNTDHANVPLVVDLTGDMSSETVEKIQSSFAQQRASKTMASPFVWIGTIHDKDCTKLYRRNADGTEANLDQLIFQRMLTYARISLTTMDQLFDTATKTNANQWKSIFKTPTSIPQAFDALIHLKSDVQPFVQLVKALAPPKEILAAAVVDEKKKSAGYKLPPDAFTSAITLSTSGPSVSSQVPLVSFNPIESYVTSLRHLFGSRAYFFYDGQGGHLIGVQWRQEFRTILESEELKFSVKNTQSAAPVFKQQSSGSSASKKSKSTVTTVITGLKIQLEEIFADMKRAGQGIVDKIETK